jgi:hypothetical protein
VTERSSEGDGFVGKRGAMDVASEVVEHDSGASNGFGEDDPALVPGDVGQRQARHGTASEMAEATSKELGQGPLGHEIRLLASRRYEPGQPIGGEAAGGHEQVDVRVPLEGAGPGVQHSACSDAPAEPARGGAEGGERIERGPEQRADARLLVLAHGAAQLRRQREDDVELGNRQQQVALALEPAPGGAVTATGAGPVIARVRQ